MTEKITFEVDTHSSEYWVWREWIIRRNARNMIIDAEEAYKNHHPAQAFVNFSKAAAYCFTLNDNKRLNQVLIRMEELKLPVHKLDYVVNKGFELVNQMIEKEIRGEVLPGSASSELQVIWPQDFRKAIEEECSLDYDSREVALASISSQYSKKVADDVKKPSHRKQFLEHAGICYAALTNLENLRARAELEELIFRIEGESGLSLIMESLDISRARVEKQLSKMLKKLKKAK